MRQSTVRQQKTAMLQMLLCGAMWSIAGIFIKQIPWNPMVISGFRGLIAAATVALCLRLSHTKIRFTRKGFWGGFFMCMTAVCFVIANKLTASANAIALQFTSPIYILLFSVLLFRQKFRRADILAVLFTSLGVVLFFLDQLAPGRLHGNLVAVAAGGFSGGMCIAMNRCDYDERMGGMLLGHLLNALLGLPFALFTAPEFSLTPMLCILILGVVQLGLPYILFVKAEEHCSPLAVNLLSVIEPILNPLWVFLFDGETPGLFAFIGAVVIIGTITLWSVHQTKSLPKE